MIYKHLNIKDLIEYIKSIQITRAVTKIHIHHTWSPNHDDFYEQGADKIQQGMYDYHTGEKGWGDIGQHITSFPDGTFGTGRDFNWNPASIKGYNTGAFAIEMVGNFDIGHDIFDGDQSDSMFELTAFLLKYFKLNLDDIIFHREKTGYKTCPGTSIDKNEFVKGVQDELDDEDADANEPDQWGKEAWEWGIKNNVCDGTRPLDNITRQEVVQMLYNKEKNDLN